MILLGILGPQELILIFLLFAAIFLSPLIALISVLRNQFQGNDKIVWVLVIIFLPFLGSVLYFLIGRARRLRKDK